MLPVACSIPGVYSLRNFYWFCIDEEAIELRLRGGEGREVLTGTVPLMLVSATCVFLLF